MNQDRDLALLYQQALLDQAQRDRLVKQAVRPPQQPQRSWLAMIGRWMIAQVRKLLAKAGKADRLPPRDWTYSPT